MERIKATGSSDDNNLSGLYKKASLAKTGFNMAGLISTLVFWLIVSFLIYQFLDAPIEIVLIFAGVQILIAMVLAIIRAYQFGSIWKVRTNEQTDSYWQIYLVNKRYGLINKIMAPITLGVAVFLIYLIYPEAATQILDKMVLGSNLTVKYLLVTLWLYQLAEVVMFWAEYAGTKNLRPAGDFAEQNRQILIIEKKFQLYRLMPVILAVVSLLVILQSEKNKIYSDSFNFILLLFIVLIIGALLSWLQIRRIASLDLEAPVSRQFITTISKKFGDEKFMASFFGVIYTAYQLKDSLKPAGYSYLGGGEYAYLENSMVVTDKRLLLLQIPMPGADKIVGGTVYTLENVFFNRQELIKKGRELIGESVDKAINYAVREYLLADIDRLTLKGTILYIDLKNGNRTAYTLMEQADRQGLADSLQKLVGDKIIIV